MSSRTDFGSNSKMADFDAARLLSGDITNLQVEGIPKADVKAKFLQALTERNMLKGEVKPAEMTEMQFQLEMKKL